LFRIAQEAVNNAIRHGKSTEIRILLEVEPDRRRLAIEDNGVGLPETVDPRDGMGLRLMNYRASMIGGSLEIRRKTDGGTVVDCTF
jgi:signal transduction histidine kinase